MNLPVPYPIERMEAEPVEGLPTGRHWQYEPKWDGFRAIVFRDGDEVAIQSRNGKPLGATSRNSCWRRTLGRHLLQTASSVCAASRRRACG